MNKQFEEAGKKARISRKTVAKYLKKHFGVPRKMKKVFITNEKKRRKNKILQKNI